jgi:hypothetical protein
MTFGPTPRHVGENWQHRHFVIIIPKNERIVPEQYQAEGNDE